ncbi:MAG TPA: hypothetical protein PKL78_03715 [Anaerolineales bacterium]|nr:hypothetical protein [Anaerolineales bacterium]
MKKSQIFICIVAALILVACGGTPSQATATADGGHNMASMFPEVETIYETYEQDGVQVEFNVKAEDAFLGNAEVAQGAYATVRFRITDTATGNPLADLRPAAWMDLVADSSSADEQVCQERVDGYLKGQVSNRPLVDLNSFFILAMNSGNSISVIDPLVQVGGVTQLYTTLLLESPGEDWVASADGNILYVSLPKEGKVAVADLQSFRVTARVPSGDIPVRLALQPDGQYLWIGNDSPSRSKSGVTIMDTRTQTIASSLTLGGGHHEIAFTPDGAFALVTSETSNEIALIDTGKFDITTTTSTGSLPVAVTVSSDGTHAYVANGGDGTVDVLTLPDLKVQNRIQIDPGITSMSPSPDGKWIFVLNPNQNKVYIVDAVSAALHHILNIPNAPDQIAFGKDLAYIRPLNGTSLYSIQLSDLNADPLSNLTEIPYAQRAPGQSQEQAIANPLATLPDEGAVLISNSADNMIYYLVEGTLAPAGSYQDQATLPRAVTFVDRSLRQEAPGIYSGKVLIPSGGNYQVAFLLNTPNLLHCFNFSAKPGANETGARAEVKVEALESISQVRRGEAFLLKFRVTDLALEQPVPGLEDFVISINQIDGNWNQRYLATDNGDGTYQVQVSIPQTGTYNILLSIASRNFGLDGMRPISFEVVE